MKQSEQSNHPAEEHLIEFALSGEPSRIHDHIATCTLCAAAVAEFKKVKQFVQSVDEHSVPHLVELQIFNDIQHGHQIPSSAGMLAFVSNPLIIALLAVVIVFVLILLVGIYGI